MRILYVGSILPGSTCEQRLHSMLQLGHEVTELRSTDLSEYLKLWSRIYLKFGRTLDLHNANAEILKATRQDHFDVCWIDKGTTIRPETLIEASERNTSMVIVSYSPDDMTIRPNRSSAFVKCLPYFDLHFTTKQHNIEKLKLMGARKVELVGNAYAPEVHRPMPNTAEDRIKLGGKVGFIGDYEQERAATIEYLGMDGIEVRVWGPNWAKKSKITGKTVRIENNGLYGDDYARAISNFDINLCFLRKAARDRQTTRTIEIPACGAFMIAERTDEHLSLFEEGKEAEFFDTNEELLEKINYYLEHDQERKKIAAAGRERCLKSGYSNQDRMKKMLMIVKELFSRQRIH